MQNYTGVAAAAGAGPIAGSVVNPVGVNNVQWIIPAGVRRLTLLARGVPVPQGSIARLGASGGLLTSGYASSIIYTGSTTSSKTEIFDGFLLPECENNATSSLCVTIYRLSPNSWNFTGMSRVNASYMFLAAGSVQLPGELTTLSCIFPSMINSGSLQLLWEF